MQPSHEPILWERPGDWGMMALKAPENKVILITHHDMTKPLQTVLGPRG